jgi:UDP-GlcNAc:undecaprenyl-phosphate GlcNAc-1-phosphate transferase
MLLSIYFSAFLLAFVLAFAFTYGVRKVALQFQVVDVASPERKIHSGSIPLLGGLAVFFGFMLTVLYFTYGTSSIFFGEGYIKPQHIIGLLFAGLFLTVGGAIDDKWNLPWWSQILFPIFAILVILVADIGIKSITSPFGGTFRLDFFGLTIFSEIFTFIWLLTMTETTKLLDGLDGLVSGITVIAGIFLFIVSLRRDLLQYDTALIAIILAGSFTGFLVWNWHPAKIFLGEGGATLAGFFIGVLAIIAGGKITTALLVMGIPFLDMMWVILRRVFFEKRFPLKGGDKKHLHFRLLSVGLSHRQAVLLYYSFVIVFGSTILFIQGKEKIFALLVLFVTMLAVGCFLVWREKEMR